MSEASGERFELIYGNTDKALVPLHVISTFRQVREELDPASIDDLKASLIIEHDDHTIETDLINEVSVAELDEKHAILYLEELNLARGTAYALDDTIPRSDRGTYIFLINGHCRRQAMEEIATEHDIPLHKIGVWVKVFKDVGYFEAVRRQLNENIHTKPKPYEEAQLIVDVFNLRTLHTPGYTAAACARELGRSPDSVLNALAYVHLPESIKSHVVKGVKYGGISYTLALELARVQRAYMTRYQQQVEAGAFVPYDGCASPEALTERQLRIFLQILYNRMGENASTSVNKLQTFINAHIATILQNETPPEFEQGVLLDVEVWGGGRRLEDTLRDRGRVAVRNTLASLLVASGVDPTILGSVGISPNELRQLAVALESAAEAQEPPRPDETLF